MKTNIIINLQVEGVHSWADCPFSEVKFLSYPHRHIFHICCKKAVEHDDRDIEIIMFKDKVSEHLKNKYQVSGNYCSFNQMSCEMIAKELFKEFDLTYCSVLEDNENGAEIHK